MVKAPGHPVSYEREGTFMNSTASTDHLIFDLYEKWGRTTLIGAWFLSGWIMISGLKGLVRASFC